MILMLIVCVLFIFMKENKALEYAMIVLLIAIAFLTFAMTFKLYLS